MTRQIMCASKIYICATDIKRVGGRVGGGIMSWRPEREEEEEEGRNSDGGGSHFSSIDEVEPPYSEFKKIPTQATAQHTDAHKRYPTSTHIYAHTHTQRLLFAA